MIRRTAFALFAGLLFSLASLPALAVGTTFSETFDRNYSATLNDYITIYDNSNFSDTFDLFNENAIINDVTLTLNFAGTNKDAEKSENWWTLYPSNAGNSFALTKTGSSEFVNQSFHLTSSELYALMDNFEDDNIFILKFYEKTQDDELDSFYLKSASLQVNYQSVPIPGAALLLGSGLLCLVGFRRRQAM